MQAGNITFNWASVLVNHSGGTYNFAQPYVSAFPSVALGQGYSGPTGLAKTAVSKTGVFLICATGASGIADYVAVGS